jgi:hypothetical protein
MAPLSCRHQETAPLVHRSTSKNPLMSLWLSAANSAAGHVRGQATRAANARFAALTRHSVRLWTDAWLKAVTGTRRR